MKKILCFLIMLLACTVVRTNTVNADENSCKYEIAMINDDGSFSRVECKERLKDALDKMKENEDYVVRNDNSLSASKIIAMNNGIVYSQPRRNGSKTMTVYQNYNFGNGIFDSKTTYISSFEEMRYVSTYEFNDDGSGQVRVEVFGFDGWIDLKACDLVPTKFLEKGLSMYLSGNDTTSDNLQAWNTQVKQNYYEVKTNGNYKDLIYKYYNYASGVSRPSEYSYTIGVAPDFMQEGVRYYSSNGYDFYSDRNCSELVGTYYNYYQFLPIRSVSKLNESDFNAFLLKMGYNENSKLWNTGSIFLNAEEKYGVNAALLFGIACNESAYGTSGYAKTRNNLFGLNAIDSNPDSAKTFNSVEQCINEMASFWIQSFVDLKDGRFYGTHLGNKGSGIAVKYASDPVWSLKAIRTVYALDKLHNNNEKLTMYDAETLALITDFDIPLKKEADDNSLTYKTSWYGPTYQKNFIVITIGEAENEYQKCVSTNPINEDRSKMLMYMDIQNGTEYNKNSSYYYIKTAYLKQLNNLKNEEIKDTPLFPDDDWTGKIRSSLSEFEIDNDVLTIKGSAYLEGVNHHDTDDISYVLNIINSKGERVSKGLKTANMGYVKTYDYNKILFEGTYDLKDLDDDDYLFEIEITKGEIKGRYYIFSSKIQYSNSRKGDYLINTDGYNGYRIEVTKSKKMLDTSSVNKPSNKASNFEFNSIVLNDNHLILKDSTITIKNTNYDETSNVSNKLILFKDGETYEFELGNKKCTIDYDAILKQEYKLNYSCLNSDTIDLSNLENGIYKIYFEMINGEYKDIIRAKSKREIENINSGKYTILLDANKGIYLKVED